MSSLKSRGALPLGNLDGGAERRLRLSLLAVRRAGQQLAMQPMQLGAVESLAGGFGQDEAVLDRFHRLGVAPRLGARIRQQSEQVTQEMTRLDRLHCGEGLHRQGDTAVRVAVFSNGAPRNDRREFGAIQLAMRRAARNAPTVLRHRAPPGLIFPQP